MGRKPLLSSDAEAAILDTLAKQNHITADQIADILEQHGVSGDPAALQRSFRKRLGQRMMASYRDNQGRREILATDGGEYVIIEYCENITTLKTVRKRLQTQIAGLDNSVSKVSGRIHTIKDLPPNCKGKAG
jgi:hypothetical protein